MVKCYKRFSYKLLLMIGDLNMTQYEAERRAYDWIYRSYQVVALAKRKSSSTYDTMYNNARDLAVVGSSYVRKLQDYATECKKNLNNPSVDDFVKDMDFMLVESKIIEVYGDAVIEFFVRELRLSSYDARQLWLKLDREALSRF